MFTTAYQFILLLSPLCYGATVLQGSFHAPQRAKIVLTNDDGWAVAQIRAEYETFTNQGFRVVLSAPAINKSGSGSRTTTPTRLVFPCQYNSCPAFSPAIGSDPDDGGRRPPFARRITDKLAKLDHINYVNAYPVDSARYGIRTLSPRLLGASPDLVFSGVNVGSNLGRTVNISGTIGAASEAAQEGFPSVAFSGVSNAHLSFKSLVTDPTGSASVAARIYANLSLEFISVLLNNDRPLMPLNTSINVNLPSTRRCGVADIKWIFARLLPDRNAKDIRVCGSTFLPDERSVSKRGCFASVSVFDARNKGDTPSYIQNEVYQKIKPILSCLP